MKENKTNLELYKEYLSNAEAIIQEFIEQYKEKGYINDDENTNDSQIKLVKATLTNPEAKDVTISTITIIPNAEFTLDYFTNLENICNKKNEITPYIIITGTTKTSLENESLPKSLKQQITNSETINENINQKA